MFVQVFFEAFPGSNKSGRIHNFQFQLMGLNGAFLTGDLFNLFVFFEVLLIASYGLALHGRGPARVKGGIHYVVLNLIGSALFLVALGLAYGTTGTLNMADFAVKVSELEGNSLDLARLSGLLMWVVFGLKAALFPLYFWLPATYASATAPVAALFAIMTKVGIYAIARVYGLAFSGGALAGLGRDPLWILALITLGLAAVGVLGARRLGEMVAYLLVMSVGTLVAGLAWSSPAAFGAMLYYLIHSTLVCGGLFLLADLVSRGRGELADRLEAGPSPVGRGVLGALFFAGAIAVAGLPPLSADAITAVQPKRIASLWAGMGNVWELAVSSDGGRPLTIIAKKVELPRVCDSIGDQRKKDSYDVDGVSLYHIKGTNAHNTRAVQVDEAAGSLNSGDCFVLLTPATLYAWHGSARVERSTNAPEH